MVLLEEGSFDAFHHRSELRRLRRLLKKGERPLAVAAGNDPRRAGLLVATDRRVLWLTPWRKRAFPLGDLQGLRWGVSRDQAVVTLEAPGLELAIARVRPEAAETFCRAVREAARAVGNPRLATRSVDDRPRPEQPLDRETAEGRMERLDRMLEKGSITYPEYLANRRRIKERAAPPPDPPTGSWWRRF